MDTNNRKLPSIYLGLSISFLVFLGILTIIMIFSSDATGDPFGMKSLGTSIFLSVFWKSLILTLIFSLLFFTLTIYPFLKQKYIHILFVLECVVLAINLVLFILMVSHFSYSFIKDTSLECQIQPWQGGTYCYETLAKTTKDINFCKKEEDQCIYSSPAGVSTNICKRASASCFAYFALKEGDQSLCPKSKMGCITALAQQLSQPNLCEEINSSDEMERRICYATLARELKDYSLCEKYVTPGMDSNYGTETYVAGPDYGVGPEATCSLLKDRQEAKSK